MKRKKKKSTKVIVGIIILIILGIIATLYIAAGIATLITLLLEGYDPMREHFGPGNILALLQSNQISLMLFTVILVFAGVVLIFINSSGRGQSFQARMMDITDNIQTPRPVGQSQHGSAKWLPKRRYGKVFDSFIIDSKNLRIRYLLDKGRFGRTCILINWKESDCIDKEDSANAES